MFSFKDARDLTAAEGAQDLALPLEQRLAKLGTEDMRQSHSAGSMTISFSVKVRYSTVPPFFLIFSLVAWSYDEPTERGLCPSIHPPHSLTH